MYHQLQFRSRQEPMRDQDGYDLLPASISDQSSMSLSSVGTFLEGHGVKVVRKEMDLNAEERKYLMSVERGDIPTVQQCLQTRSGRLNKNCVDPLGRTALLIAIENDNIEMIELLLSHRVELRDALLHAINEDNVEATQLILRHQDMFSAKSPSANNVYENPSNKEKAAKITARWKKLTLKKPDANENLHEKVTRTRSEEIQGGHRSVTDDFSSTNSSPGFPGIQRDESLEDSTFMPSSTQHSSSFTPDITPIILAGHRDNYEIIKILLDRGDSIAKPHDIRCSCDDCVRKSLEDSLNHSLSRINAYRALSSPSLIALSSRDPILTAFELSWELRLLSRLENELKTEYTQLSQQCRDFAVDLLDQVRGSKELEVLLNYEQDSCPYGSSFTPSNYSNGSAAVAASLPTTSESHTDRMNLSRLKLAIKYKQKRFVAHANCQQLLASLWYEGLLGFRRRHIVFKVLLTTFVSLMFPLLSITYMIAPKCCVGQFMRRPFIKFICHSSSYLTFLVLLILASQRIESIISLTGSRDDNTDMKMTREVRGAPPTSIEWMILVYVLGLIWSEVKQLWDQGVKSYINDMWNILDFITNSLYIATYTLKLVAYLRVEEEKRLGNAMALLSRKDWDAYDPTLISEGLFAAANIFSSLKLIYMFTVNPHLGPLQISLGRMVIDIMKFLFIALLVCFSYSCGVNQLYWYYAEARNRECSLCEQRRLASASNETTVDCHCEKALANLFEIIQTLYFAVYGLVEIRNFELKERHEFTQFVGKLMYGTYLGIMTIVLINMFIAMLSSSFQKISNDADTEWKFARSRLWMSYFDEGGTVPAPFNIIPTPKTFYYIASWFWERLCRCSKKARTNKWQSIRRAMRKKRERDAVYEKVIHDLVKRYVMKRQRETSAEGVSEDDINEIKQDISSFRYELLQILKSNGMKLPSANTQQQSSTGSGGSKQRRKSNRMSMKFAGPINEDLPPPAEYTSALAYPSSAECPNPVINPVASGHPSYQPPGTRGPGPADQTSAVTHSSSTDSSDRLYPTTWCLTPSSTALSINHPNDQTKFTFHDCRGGEAPRGGEEMSPSRRIFLARAVMNKQKSLEVGSLQTLEEGTEPEGSRADTSFTSVEPSEDGRSYPSHPPVKFSHSYPGHQSSSISSHSSSEFLLPNPRSTLNTPSSSSSNRPSNIISNEIHSNIVNEMLREEIIPGDNDSIGLCQDETDSTENLNSVNTDFNSAPVCDYCVPSSITKTERNFCSTSPCDRLEKSSVIQLEVAELETDVKHPVDITDEKCKGNKRASKRDDQPINWV